MTVVIINRLALEVDELSIRCQSCFLNDFVFLFTISGKSGCTTVPSIRLTLQRDSRNLGDSISLRATMMTVMMTMMMVMVMMVMVMMMMRWLYLEGADVAHEVVAAQILDERQVEPLRDLHVPRDRGQDDAQPLGGRLAVDLLLHGLVGQVLRRQFRHLVRRQRLHHLRSESVLVKNVMLRCVFRIEMNE